VFKICIRIFIESNCVGSTKFYSLCNSHILRTLQSVQYNIQRRRHFQRAGVIDLSVLTILITCVQIQLDYITNTYNVFLIKLPLLSFPLILSSQCLSSHLIYYNSQTFTSLSFHPPASDEPLSPSCSPAFQGHGCVVPCGNTPPPRHSSLSTSQLGTPPPDPSPLHCNRNIPTCYSPFVSIPNIFCSPNCFLNPHSSFSHFLPPPHLQLLTATQSSVFILVV
jgi:type III secretory pathway component EscS